MNSELMRQLVALNDKVVNGEDLNQLQRQLRSELSALLAQETSQKQPPTATSISTVVGTNDSLNGPVYVSPATFHASAHLGHDTDEEDECTNDPVDCSPSSNDSETDNVRRTQVSMRNLSVASSKTSAPVNAGTAQNPSVFQPVDAREAFHREQDRLQREAQARIVAEQEQAKQRERARQEQAQRAWAQQEAERQQRRSLTTEGDHTVRKCSSCGHSTILVEGMYRDNRDTMEVHTCQRCNDKLHYNHTSFDGCTINRNGTDGHRFVSGIRVDYSKVYNVPV